MSAYFSMGDKLTPLELRDIWRLLSPEERALGLELLPHEDADDFFISLQAPDQVALMAVFTPQQEKSFLRLLAPDDIADLVQHTPADEQAKLLSLLDTRTHAEVVALLRYKEDDAGGLMNPRFVRLRPDMSAEEALWYLRRQAHDTAETIYVAYVCDTSQRLLGAVSLREILQADKNAVIANIMTQRPVSVREDAPQEEVWKVFATHDLNVVPVVDAAGFMKGIVTVDDIVDVVQEEATEDIQRMGGVKSLDQPYTQVGWLGMLNKRAGWLTALFISEMLTATALGHYEEDIKKATVLALFLTLINSAGGNSGSQSTALVVRALALGELRLRDWFFVFKREMIAGLSLGGLLGCIGWLRVVLWEILFSTYGPAYMWVGLTIGLTLICVVTWGTISGAMLPFIIARCGFDPATASAPFVATFVDVTAIIIYFQVAQLLLRGLLL